MKRNRITMIAVFMLLVNQYGRAQNCLAKFESDAGPDIEACSGGQVNLSGIIGGDATRGVWKGGKGIFEPSRTSLEAHYFPADDEKGTVVLTLEAFNPKFPECLPVSSRITLTLHKEPHVTTNESMRAAAGNDVQLQGTLTGDAQRITWTSTGSGTFSDGHLLNAVYTPSKTDIKNGGCSLTLSATPYNGCPPDSASLSLSISGNTK